MEPYNNKPREELLKICTDKFISGRTYEELLLFLDRHHIDKDTQQYIFDELEKVEENIKNNSPKKKQISFRPMNMVVGITLIALGLAVLLIDNMHGNLYIMALFIAIAGIVFIGIEVAKAFLNLFREY
ncbi:MAG: hypothetical protein LBL90_04730 [Prevotellaceae bacterium]|nr:hypothetical protein [Prevotellaceae bacterium]